MAWIVKNFIVNIYPNNVHPMYLEKDIKDCLDVHRLGRTASCGLPSARMFARETMAEQSPSMAGN